MDWNRGYLDGYNGKWFGACPDSLPVSYREGYLAGARDAEYGFPCFPDPER